MGQIDLYLVGAGMLGDAMGEAAFGKGIETGRQWPEPSKGDIRVDMNEPGNPQAGVAVRHRLPSRH
jgi:hypothetical protein